MTSVRTTDIKKAKDGDARALEALVRGVQDQVYRLALRMLADTGAAQDATQDILIRVITKLSTYRGDSQFETWVYRVATNYLLTARKVIAKDPGLSFQAFSEDLLDGLVDEESATAETHVMLNELRLRCTMAMLLCLDRDHRAAYVLGEVLDLSQRAAAEVLEISEGNYRKRLSRARAKVEGFTAATCGVANRNAACSCPRRLPAALASGCIGQRPSAELAGAPGYAAARQLAESAAEGLVAASLQRAMGPLTPLRDYAAEVLRLVDHPG